ADANIGDIIKTELFPPENYGRMAAQTAKQVIIQRLREAERDMTFKEYSGRVGEIITGTVQRLEGRVVLVDLGHATAVMPPAEQVERERYMPGQRVKVFLIAVNSTTRGPEILVSRSHPDMVRKLFAQEVPEVASGVITIKAVAREAGSRTKIAVYTTEPNIDPVGSCVGQRGTRVQTVIAELGGEKIDIIQFEEDVVRFIINALSPAKVISVKLHEEERRAIAEVKEDQLSLAIGRAGQNVRLAAKLTGWRIDIVKENEPEPQTQPAAEEEKQPTSPTEPPAEPATPKEEPKPDAPPAADNPAPDTSAQ
ncbi:MAG: transcription termination/antitermination protein NusA, partial [Candidatus Kerfeldbacteria bacterium]|nr:transcription termination/antitermination protein NusA [Candidatus Kerfeldbacteria bacterium]